MANVSLHIGGASVASADSADTAERVERVPATEASMLQVDGTPVDMKIVSITHDDYEDLTTPEANTLYLTTS